jgi:hypothetical protein
MERFLLLVIVVSSRLPPREEEEEHRTSDADAAAAAARMWSCVPAQREERERRRGPLLFLFSVMRCAFTLVVSFFSFVWSQKKIRKKKGKRGKKYDTNATKKKVAHAFDRKPAHSSTLPYGLFMRRHLTVPGFEPGICLIF